MILLQVLLLFIIIRNCLTEYNLSLSATIDTTFLVRYLSYSDAVIIHLNIPENTVFASFQFRSYEESDSQLFTKCDIRDLTIYLKSNAPPVINPDGSKIPELFVNFTRDPTYHIGFKTDNKTNFINITSPLSTTYFAAAFLNYKNPKRDKIKQQGLYTECTPFLVSDLYISTSKNITLLIPNINLTIKLNSADDVYRFYVPDNINHMLISIRAIDICQNCTNIVLNIQAENAPFIYSSYEFDNLIINETYIIRFRPQEENWHYINFPNGTAGTTLEIYLKYFSGYLPENLRYQPNTGSKKKINASHYMVQKYSANDLDTHIFHEYNLIKYGKSEPFTYIFDIQPITQDKVYPLYLNVSNKFITTLKFSIISTMDIGGTLVFDVSIAPEKLKRNKTLPNATIIVCMRKDIKEIPTWPNECVYEDQINDALAVLNIGNKSKSLLIPFPEMGRWYVTMKLFCGKCSTCECSEDCKEDFRKCKLNCDLNCTDDDNYCTLCNKNCKTEVLSRQECKSCDCNEACIKEHSFCEDNIVYSLMSQACVNGECSNGGKCGTVLYDGFAYSTCFCLRGYRGWDCSDGSMSDSAFLVLVGVLLLTLSNLFFIPTIYFAFKRDYTVEAIVYCFTMTFSFLYHSCDANVQSGLCVMPLRVLQFCDFYCGLYAIWVTLIAMSYLSPKLTSICHTCGAILLACGTTLNKEALWVFFVPVLIGIVILSGKWTWQSFRRKEFYPARHYLKIYFPIGILVATLGLIIYGFLQTQQNYKYLHSFWHITIAISVLFLLPDKKYLQ